MGTIGRYKTGTSTGYHDIVDIFLPSYKHVLNGTRPGYKFEVAYITIRTLFLMLLVGEGIGSPQLTSAPPTLYSMQQKVLFLT